MSKIHVSDALEWQTFEVECAYCKFYNNIFIRDVRMGFSLICRGCKTNIVIEDYWSSYKHACERIDNMLQEALDSLQKALTITI
jgi:hypothetical protein